MSAAQALPAGVTWDWQLQAPLDLSVAVDVLALDPDEVSAADIAALSARGVFTICYVSVGTREEWRGDAADFPVELVGQAYGRWPGERFLDIRDVRLLPLMEARFRRCAGMGFDAVEPDNIDLHINDTGFALGSGDVVAYFAELARIAHVLGLEVAQKNAPDLTAQLAPLADFAMTENCLADGWCADMATYPASGRAVLSAEYMPLAPGPCMEARALGLSVIFKTRDLTRALETCPSS